MTLAVNSLQQVRQRRLLLRLRNCGLALHCVSGPGPNNIGVLRCGKGESPANNVHAALCAWPQVARWTGKGSADEAANFECVEGKR